MTCPDLSQPRGTSYAHGDVGSMKIQPDTRVDVVAIWLSSVHGLGMLDHPRAAEQRSGENSLNWSPTTQGLV